MQRVRLPALGGRTMSNQWIARGVSVTATMIGVCAVSMPAVAKASSTVPAGVIVYAHGQRLRTILPDGSDRSRVGGGYGQNPVWSPDGSRLAFDFGGIDTMRADGTHVRHLTSARDTEPS